MTPPRSSDTSIDRTEFSAGGVVVRGDEVIVIVPVRRDARGNRVLGLPKGHPDGDETPAQAAAREVAEETGVRAELIDELGDIEYRSGDVRDHDHEIEDARWMPLQEAARTLTYDGERKIVARALSKLGADR